MDQKGISPFISIIMVIAGLMSLGYCLVMLIAAVYKSTLLLLLSNFLIIPAFIVMVVITIQNWRKSSEIYDTFEEIAKKDLDRYFNDVNRGIT